MKVQRGAGKKSSGRYHMQYEEEYYYEDDEEGQDESEARHRWPARSADGKFRVRPHLMLVSPVGRGPLGKGGGGGERRRAARLYIVATFKHVPVGNMLISTPQTLTAQPCSCALSQQQFGVPTSCNFHLFPAGRC